MPRPTDAEIMQDAYDNLSRAFGLRAPKDPKLERAFMKARTVVDSALLTLREPYREAREAEMKQKLKEQEEQKTA